MKKVFINSVMKNFRPERKAARLAVEALDMRPIVAEDFGPKSYLSQVAYREPFSSTSPATRRRRSRRVHYEEAEKPLAC